MSGDIRALYAFICDTTRACPDLMALLDGTSPVRRMQMGVEAPWRNVLTYGKATRMRLTPGTRRPIYRLTWIFEPWIRGEVELATAGDLILADIEQQLMRIFEYAEPRPETCEDIRVYECGFDGFSTEPEFVHEMQAWNQQHRFYANVLVPTCRPVPEWCGPPCP